MEIAMMSYTTRRSFIQRSAAAGFLAGLSGLESLGSLPGVAAADAQLDPNTVSLPSEIEPLVRLLEETPQERLLEEVAARIRGGCPYRAVLAALLLAGVRNVQPRPSVGFKFHAVLVVSSAHLASLASPDSQRWLPIFWALDYFKSAQAQDVREGNWTMHPVNESAIPAPHRARQALANALDSWDEGAADAAAAGVARSAGAHEAFELLLRYGARDFRSIGHKAIFVAGSYRVLQVIGWRYAEPVLRSLAYALLMYDGTNPSQADAEADRPGRENLVRAGEIRAEWLDGKPDDAACAELLAALREAGHDEVCRLVVAQLNRGVAVQSIWDALLTGAGELLIRQPGIVALHAVTTSNALRYAFESSGDDLTRRFLLLQNAAFLPLFREAMRQRGAVADVKLDQWTAAAPTDSDPAAAETVLANIGRDPEQAARNMLGYLQAGRDPQLLVDAARLLVFAKGTDSHDYKFSSAVLEDYQYLSPKWRPYYLASSTYKLRGSQEADNPLVARILAALAGQ
jgi:hypothetical protein